MVGISALGQEVTKPGNIAFAEDVQPLVKEYCLKCHSTEKQKGDLDLERFSSLAEVLNSPDAWQRVVEQIELGEMPPQDKPQLTTDERLRLVQGVDALLNEAALARAGDPGPVVLRRLNNAEFTYTIRDLTGVGSLDPVKEFPADSASGEGFMNVGNSLVMSPSLMTKYLDAAKEIANHAVLLPDGIAFSRSTSQRDWTEEKLAAIRAFYSRFSKKGGGSAVNLQGIKFDTKDGGVLPLEKYLEALIQLRMQNWGWANEHLLSQIAAERGLSSKYLTTLVNALTATNTSPLLDPIREQWRAAKPGDAAGIAQSIAIWQQALWRFTQVGHIGKRDGPKAWQEPVTPLAEAREVRLKIPAPPDGKDVTLYLVASDAGDGNENDFAVWENPRLVAPGQPDLPLREVHAVINTLTAYRKKVFSSAAKCLAAASEMTGPIGPDGIAQLAQKHGVEPVALAAWFNCLGIGSGEAQIDSYIAGKTEHAENYDFIKGWVGDDALSVIANSSDQHVRVPGNMKPHGIAVHPSPKLRVVVGWRSPAAATIRVEGAVQRAHPECGNGVTWALELRRGSTRQRLASGTAQDVAVVKFVPVENLTVQSGDMISVVVGPRDGNHSCDLTAVDLTLSDGTKTWDLAKDVSPNILAGNPHADSLGNSGVWHFYSEPDSGGGAEPVLVLPAGSLLARWQSSNNIAEKQELADELQNLLIAGGADLTKDAPDAALYRQLTSLNGPLLASIVGSSQREEALTDQNLVASSATNWGVDPALFAGSSLPVHTPSVIEVRLPAEFAEGCEFVATATLNKQTGAEGTVQMQVLTTKPKSMDLAAGVVREQGSKSTWSDGERPVVSDSPILVVDGSVAQMRIKSVFDEFRQLFPAALCYTKIVPVDEVVTLTLFYREDDALRRLMLDDEQAAEIDRLWAELHYVSQDPLKLVDGFEQLWQFATQDADPSAFEPLREPIKRHAEEFRKLLLDTQPAQLEAVLKFAERAYRRPLSDGEQNELRGLYLKLRSEDLPHEHAVRLTLARVMVAPAFLYRIEEPPPGDRPGPVNDWELATRLSYFLWSTAPDAELLAVAATGKIGEPKVLTAQAKRMLQDPRVRRLATEFACAWLHVYDFNELDEKSPQTFPTFNGLRDAMYEETIRFFTDLFRSNGSVLDILDADYTFVNAELAAHYGIPDSVLRGSGWESAQNQVREDQSRLASAATLLDDGWHRVEGVKQYGRGGILAQATTLAKQSGASRTSPILRGNWLCEVLLGEKLPRPPKDVPQLPEDEATETLTVRELTEKHTIDLKCYGCHKRIDPYGYSLEAFDAIGRHRDQDLGGRPIDTRAKTMDGTEFEGLDGLREYLLTTRRDAFLKQFCRKLLGYSLGRGIMLSDGPLISGMQEQLKTHDYQITAAIEAIVRSQQFREIRGKEMAGEE